MSTVPDLLNGRYRLEKLLGQGGMADVYRARDELTGTDVAVKLVRSADPEFASRLAQEARALSDLDHPGLVRMLDAGTSGSEAFLVMDLVEGETLGQALRRRPIPPEWTATLGATLAGGLACVHDHGIVHRDVKPGNVLLSSGGRARLADFGIASLADGSSLTATGTTIGTAAYMAPEQLEHHQVGPGADIWSLGMVLLECLTGQRIYEGTPSEVVGRRLAGPVPIPETLPTPWRLLLSGMLDHDPNRRPSAAEVATLLASPAFATPWDPAATALVTTLLPAAGTHDLRALAQTTAVPATAAPNYFEPTVMAQTTLPAQPDPTMISMAAVLPPLPPTPAPIPLRPRPVGVSPEVRRRRALVAAIVAVLVVLAVLVVILLLATNHPAGTGVTSSTTTVPTTSTSSTTSTTAPNAATAAANLVHDLTAAGASGALSPDTVRTATADVGTAVADAGAGRTTAAADALNAIDASVAQAQQGGSMSAGQAALLQGDLAALAAVLGLPAPSPTTTSTTTASTTSTSTTTSTTSTTTTTTTTPTTIPTTTTSSHPG